METVKCLPRVYFDTEEVRSSILLSPTNFVNLGRASARPFSWFFAEAGETQCKLSIWLIANCTHIATFALTKTTLGVILINL
jgi:hypothetical protein